MTTKTPTVKNLLAARAINQLLEAAQIPLRVNETADAVDGSYAIPVPEGFSSLFAACTIEVHESRRNPGAYTIDWRYKHPGGGSNGYGIGEVFADDHGARWRVANVSDATGTVTRDELDL